MRFLKREREQERGQDREGGGASKTIAGTSGRGGLSPLSRIHNPGGEGGREGGRGGEREQESCVCSEWYSITRGLIATAGPRRFTRYCTSITGVASCGRSRGSCELFVYERA